MNHHCPKHLQALPFRKDGRKAWGQETREAAPPWMHLRQLRHLRIQGTTALHAEVFVVICGHFVRMLWVFL